LRHPGTLGTPYFNERSREICISTTTSMSLLLTPVDSTRSWFDIIAELEDRTRTRLLRLSAAEWKEEGRRLVQAHRGRDIEHCLKYLADMDRLRADYVASQAAPPQRPAARRRSSPFSRDFAFWRDVVEEPHKYGTDTLERWLVLDDKLRSGPGRWRVDAYWFAKDQEVEDLRRAEEEAEAEELAAAQAPFRALYSQCAAQAAWNGEKAWWCRDMRRVCAAYRAERAALAARRSDAATRIAAAVRGHLARTRMPFRDCCMCLSHRTCAFQTAVGPLCRGCRELGPYADETGPIPDEWNWYRSDCLPLRP
jgi:hypothetical protein